MILLKWVSCLSWLLQFGSHQGALAACSSLIPWVKPGWSPHLGAHCRAPAADACWRSSEGAPWNTSTVSVLGLQQLQLHSRASHELLHTTCWRGCWCLFLESSAALSHIGLSLLSTLSGISGWARWLQASQSLTSCLHHYHSIARALLLGDLLHICA